MPPIKAKLSYNPPAVIEQRAPGARALLLCGSSQFAALWLAAQATTTHFGPRAHAVGFRVHGEFLSPHGGGCVNCFLSFLCAPAPPPFLSLSFYWSWSGRRADAAALLPPPPAAVSASAEPANEQYRTCWAGEIRGESGRFSLQNKGGVYPPG